MTRATVAKAIGPTLRGRLRGILLGALAAAAWVPAAPAASSSFAGTAPPPDDVVTWAVEPADENGPDGRRWMELTLDPGDEVVEHLAVRNLGSTPATFALQAADGYLTPDGAFTILTADEESTGAGSWIAVAQSVTVDPGQVAVVPFTVAVPVDATPGDHAAGVAASLRTTAPSGVSVDSRVGFRVMTHVTGELTPSLAVTNVQAQYRPSGNPFAPGSLRVTYTVENAGNARLAVEGQVVAGSWLGDVAVAAPRIAETMPGDARSGEVIIDGVWPAGRVGATIELTGVSPDGVEEDVTVGAAADTAAWAMPWAQLVVLVAVGALALAIVLVRRRRRRQLASMLAEAREEGRAEALRP